MIIAIDESGSFESASTRLNFFVAAHIRQRRTLYKTKKDLFASWEKSLPRSLKNAKGEIKSSSLSDEQLEGFAAKVIIPHPYIGITPVAIRPSDNPPVIIEKHRSLQMIGIREGSRDYAEMGKPKLAKTIEELGHWFNKLSYVQYLKIVTLGLCISSSLSNTVGHAISGNYDDELVRMRFILDKDFIREPRPNIFWREVLRNQIYSFSKKDPLPLLDKWKRRGHPFLEKYVPHGQINLNELFWKNCSFSESHEYFEIRIADAITTIISRYFNDRNCEGAYRLIRNCILRDGSVAQYVLPDFDVSSYDYDKEDNPWRNQGATIQDESLIQDREGS